MNRLIKKILMVVLCCNIVLPIYGQTIRYVYTDYYPANYVDKEGNPAGFFVDILREALTERMGIQLSIQVFPWLRCQNLVANGQADLLTTIPTAERLVYTNSTTIPIWIKHYQLYTWAEHPDIEKINNIKHVEDLEALNLSIVSYLGNSWAQDTLKNKGLKVVFATSVESMYRILEAKRADILIDDPILVDPAIKKLGIADHIVITNGIVEQSRFHILIGQKSPFLDIIDRLDQTLDTMWQDGTIDTILESYRSL